MSEVAIRVSHLSKLYRIGEAEQRHETLLGAALSFLKSPISNYRSLRRLSKFDDVLADDTKQKAEIRKLKAEISDQRSEISPQPSAFSPQPSQAAPQLSAFNSPPSDASSHLSDVIYALRDVSFEVKRGEVVGIIGLPREIDFHQPTHWTGKCTQFVCRAGHAELPFHRRTNGAGKSTLLKILARITEPTSGRAEIHGRVASLLEVGTGFHPDLTGRENIYLNGTILGMKKREIDKRLDEIVEFSGVEEFIDTPVKRYSSGMRVRLAFSIAAHLEPEILLVDEVLAVWDAEFQKNTSAIDGASAEGPGGRSPARSPGGCSVRQPCGQSNRWGLSVTAPPRRGLHSADPAAKMPATCLT